MLNTFYDLNDFNHMFSLASLVAVVYRDLGGDSRMIVNWKAIALLQAYLLSNRIIESSESHERKTATSLDSHASIGSWDSEMKYEMELMSYAFSWGRTI